MLDTGPERALSEEEWLRLFGAEGVRELSWVGLSHLDEDHSGGLRRLVRLIRIRCVVASTEEWSSERGVRLRDALSARGVETSDWQAGCFPFESLSVRKKSGKTNTLMTVVSIPFKGGGQYIGLGDLDGAMEPRVLPWILGTLRERPHASKQLILKVAHHGSRHSTGSEVLARLHPRLALVSAGVGNHYGHPSPELLERLRRAGVPWLRTDRQGALRWMGQNTTRSAW